MNRELTNQEHPFNDASLHTYVLCSKEEKMRMIEILKRMKEEEEEEDGCDEDGPTLEERLAGISLGQLCFLQ